MAKLDLSATDLAAIERALYRQIANASGPEKDAAREAWAKVSNFNKDVVVVSVNGGRGA